jgi:hypothetical protein
LEIYFWDLIDKYATEPLGVGFTHAKEILEPEIRNICSLVKNAVQSHPSTQIVKIAVDVSQFLLYTVPSTEVLDDVTLLVMQIGTPTLQACVLQ